MIVSTIATPVRPAEHPARPSRFRVHAGHRGPRVDIAALLRHALIRNELLLTIAATSRRSVAQGR